MPPRRRRSPAAAAGGRRPPRTYTGHPVSLDFQGADLRAVLRTFSEISGAQHRHRPGRPGHGGRRAARRAVGPGARHHPARQQARLRRRRHDRPHRAARRCSPTRKAQRRKLADEQALAGELQVHHARRSATRKAEDLEPLLTRQRAVASAATIAGRPAHEHAHHQRPARRASRRPTALLDALDQAAAAGRDRGADRPDHPRLRPRDRRAVGLQRAGRRRSSATRPALAFPNKGSLSGRTGGIQGAARRARRRGTAVNLAVPAATQRHRPRARVGQRRVQPRRRAVGARADGARAASCRRRACRRRTTSRPRSRRACRSRFRRSRTTR